MPITAVLIDDDQEDLDILQGALEMHHAAIHCISFISPTEAIKVLTDELLIVPEFIFIDINMPQMHGAECLRELRRLPHNENTVITILSTSVTSFEKKELKKSGANYVFEKPAKFEDLQNILGQIIR